MIKYLEAMMESQQQVVFFACFFVCRKSKRKKGLGGKHFRNRLMKLLLNVSPSFKIKSFVSFHYMTL